MSDPTQKAVAEELLNRHGRTFAEEIGIDVEAGTPAPLFQLLYASVLFSTRISAKIAASGTKALIEAGWTTPTKMQESTWRQRTDVLNRAGYARYDESTSRMLADMTDYLISTYDGDLRNLREAAHGKPEGVRARLKEFKGIGDAGADIFLREVQVAWTEFCPFVDKKAQKGADALGLNTDTASLKRYAGDDPHDIARLIAAMVRSSLEHDEDDVRGAAA